MPTTTAKPRKAAKKTQVAPLPGRTQLVELTADQARLVAELKANRAEAARLKKAIDAASDVLKAVAGTSGMIGVIDGQPVVKFGDGAWKGTDEKLLAEAFPEAFAATRAIKPYVTVSPL